MVAWPGAESETSVEERFKAPLHGAHARRGFVNITQIGASINIVSKLLKRVGDHYRFDNQKERALGRYAAAWYLDPSNTDAAVSFASLLVGHPGAKRPARTLSDHYVPHFSFFSKKEFRGSLNPDLSREHLALEAKDWMNLVSMYRILADADPENSRKHLLRSVRTKRQLDLNYSADRVEDRLPLGSIHFALAEGLESSRPDRAAQEYANAAGEFSRTGSEVWAARAKQKADTLSPLGYSPVIVDTLVEKADSFRVIVPEGVPGIRVYRDGRQQEVRLSEDGEALVTAVRVTLDSGHALKAGEKVRISGRQQARNHAICFGG